MSATIPTKTELRRMAKPELIRFGRQTCLLEHLDDAELEAMTKKALLTEIDAALICAEVYEDRRALATDSMARPTAELLGLTAPEAEEAPKAKAPAPRNYTDHPDGRAAVAHGGCTQCGSEKGTRCLAKKGGETIYVHGPRFKAWEAAEARKAARAAKKAQA